MHDKKDIYQCFYETLTEKLPC